MTKKLTVKGIQTNNLKNLDIGIKYNSVTCITGVSGGGKTSLGFATIHGICSDEFYSIEHGHEEFPKYSYNSCNGIIPSVAIEQINKNNNPRSSIYTFLNIASIVALENQDIFTTDKNNPLRIQSYQNCCTHCSGLGRITTPNMDVAINELQPLKEIPFLPFKKNRKSTKYHDTFLQMCIDLNLSLESQFRNLTPNTRHKLLIGKHKLSRPVTFQDGQRRRTTSYYLGIKTYLESQTRDGKSSYEYHVDIPCPECSGSRINKNVQSLTVYGLPFRDFLLLPITELKNYLSSSHKKLRILPLLEQMCDLGLGYLSLSRSIPSLSGGELQKIKLSRLLDSRIEGILIVIDEISAQVHPSDYKKIFSLLSNESRKNTILLIEHNDYFIDRSTEIICVGPKAGSKGGYIIPYEPRLPPKEPQPFTKGDFFIIKSITENNVIDQELTLYKEKINVLVGRSGSGKSSIARYIERSQSPAEYIDQKPIKASYSTTVASYLALLEVMYSLFPKSYSFSPCKKCSGSGVIRIQRSFDSDIDIICPKCDGKLYTAKSLSHRIRGRSIFDLLSEEVEDLKYELEFPDSKLQKAIDIMTQLHLSHICLSRRVCTLSLGEMKRLRLARSLLKKKNSKKILIIDEPGAGLDNPNCFNLMEYLHSVKCNYKCIIVIDHKPSIFLKGDSITLIGPGSGNKGGKVIGTMSAMEYHKKYKNNDT